MRTSTGGREHQVPKAVDDVRAKKDELRARLRAERAALALAEVRAASAAVCRHLDELAALGRAQHVAVYAARSGEIDPAQAAERLRARGVAVAYPRDDGERLTFHAARASELELGSFGIPAPLAGAPEVELDACDVVLVPGVAFDRAGHRLGQGGGFYDRALSAAPRALRVGLAHAFQVIDGLPCSERDEPVDVIVTPDGAHATGARPAHAPLEVQS
jgi:5-formyltetrahydrofolate cyclo-ligase